MAVAMVHASNGDLPAASDPYRREKIAHRVAGATEKKSCRKVGRDWAPPAPRRLASNAVGKAERMIAIICPGGPTRID